MTVWEGGRYESKGKSVMFPIALLFPGWISVVWNVYTVHHIAFIKEGAFRKVSLIVTTVMST